MPPLTLGWLGAGAVTAGAGARGPDTAAFRVKPGIGAASTTPETLGASGRSALAATGRSLCESVSVWNAFKGALIALGASCTTGAGSSAGAAVGAGVAVRPAGLAAFAADWVSWA